MRVLVSVIFGLCSADAEESHFLLKKHPLPPANQVLQSASELDIDLTVPTGVTWVVAIRVDPTRPAFFVAGLRPQNSGAVVLRDHPRPSAQQTTSGSVRLQFDSMGTSEDFLAFVSVPAPVRLKVLSGGVAVTSALVQQSVLLKNGVARTEPGTFANAVLSLRGTQYGSTPRPLTRLPDGSLLASRPALRDRLITDPEISLTNRCRCARSAFLEIQVDERGIVQSVSTANTVGEPDLDSLDSKVRTWRFRPFDLGGQPVAVRGILHFVADSSGALKPSWQ